MSPDRCDLNVLEHFTRRYSCRLTSAQSSVPLLSIVTTFVCLCQVNSTEPSRMLRVSHFFKVSLMFGNGDVKIHILISAVVSTLGIPKSGRSLYQQSNLLKKVLFLKAGCNQYPFTSCSPISCLHVRALTSARVVGCWPYHDLYLPGCSHYPTGPETWCHTVLFTWLLFLQLHNILWSFDFFFFFGRLRTLKIKISNTLQDLMDGWTLVGR